jgi:hypothetical protein
MQSVPYAQYRSSPAYTGANFLWIKGATAWTQYAVAPQGATLSLFAISPIGGSGSLASDGQTYSNNYVFYPNSLLTFYAGTIGRHTLSFAINDQSSNQVVIDVVGGTYTQPSNNPKNYPGYYPAHYYPWDYGYDALSTLPVGWGHRGGHPGAHPHTGTHTRTGTHPHTGTHTKPGGVHGKK